MKLNSVSFTAFASTFTLCAALSTHALAADCQQGGYLDEHPNGNTNAKFQGVVSNASMNGLNHYSAHFSQVDNSNHHEERDLDITLKSNGTITINENPSNQTWKGEYQKIGDYIYFDTQGEETNTGKSIDYQGVGCFRAV